MRNHLLIGFAFLLSGCAYYRPVAVSTTHIDPERMTSLGTVQGSAVNMYFLGIIGSQEQGMRTAFENAKFRANADNLLNVFVDERVTYYPFTFLPLVTKVETILSGTAVKYKNQPTANDKASETTVPLPPARDASKRTDGTF